MTDLSWWNPDGPAMTPDERKRMKNRVAAQPRGYAALPGTGPEGETCKSCRHIVRLDEYAKVYRKCGLVRDRWTHGPGTDIKAGKPACRRWERSE